MKTTISKIMIAGAVLFLSTGCSGSAQENNEDSDSIEDTDFGGIDECAEDPEALGILAVPEGFENYSNAGFTKYTEVVAPNGKPIRIFAHTKVKDLALLRARNLLEYYLTDFPGSAWGENKAEVANQMADNEAVLIMPPGADGDSAEPSVWGQPLYEDETVVEGSSWYMNNDYEHRDAAFEEIFHLVHDTGIGTDFPGALPQYQAQLLAEAQKAIEDRRWGIPVDPEVEQWIEELAQEGSLAQEYIASVIDSYYGLWGPWDEADGGMWGIYIAKNRDEIAQLDPEGKALLEAFLPPYLTYLAVLDGDLNGTFEMTFDPQKPYTHKSRYLVNVRLTGCNDSAIFGNDRDNRLQGNVGNNTMDGHSGDDTVVFKGNRDEYTVSKTSASILVEDSIASRDGSDTLINIEYLEFSDQTLLSGEI